MPSTRRKFIGSAALAGTSLLAAPGIGLAKSDKAPEGTKFSIGETRGHRSKTPSPALDALCNHIGSAKFSDLDPIVIQRAKQRLLDLTGCAIAGVRAPGNAAFVRALSSASSSDGVSILGYPGKFQASAAAMANAIISRSYDFEVMTVVAENLVLGSHHAPTTCMTALALSEQHRLSGADFLMAMIVGDDVAGRVLAASGMDLNLGWDGTGTYSALGATAIAARLMRLNPQQTADAFGSVSDMIAGTIQSFWDGSSGWKFGQGQAARNGIFAAELASAGWIGIGDGLLAPYGFFGQFTPGAIRPEFFTKNLGEAYYAEEYYKPYPSCGATHVPHECALKLRSKFSIDPATIQSIKIRLPESSLGSAVAQQPFVAGRDVHCSANFSILYQTANALLRGRTRLEHYSETEILSAGMKRLLPLSSIEALRADEQNYSVVVEVTTKNNRSYTEQIENQYFQRTPAEIRTSTSVINEKFREQVQFAGISTAIADELVDYINTIEKKENVAEFTALFNRAFA
jgi:2-methylcitrate dehydratase